MWVAARSQYHADITDKDVPQTKAEQKKSISDQKILKAKKHREKHDEEWLRAIGSPRHFGSFLGLESVLGAPPEETVKSAKEIKEERKAAFDDFRRRFEEAAGTKNS